MQEGVQIAVRFKPDEIAILRAAADDPRRPLPLSTYLRLRVLEVARQEIEERKTAERGGKKGGGK